MASRPPTKRQYECFELFARLGDQQLAARMLGLSVQRMKHNCAEYYRRVGANSGIQAAYITWARRE